LTAWRQHRPGTGLWDERYKLPKRHLAATPEFSPLIAAKSFLSQ
jgi:hypothetical protein